MSKPPEPSPRSSASTFTTTSSPTSERPTSATSATAARRAPSPPSVASSTTSRCSRSSFAERAPAAAGAPSDPGRSISTTMAARSFSIGAGSYSAASGERAASSSSASATSSICSSAATLTRGKLVGIMADALLQPHLAQQGLGPRGTMIDVLVHRQHRHLHILQGAQRRQQVERLKDESNLARAICVQVNGRSQRLVLEQHFAAGGRIQPAQQLQQRRLAAAAGPADGEVLARADGQVYSAQGLDTPVVVAFV